MTLSAAAIFFPPTLHCRFFQSYAKHQDLSPIQIILTLHPLPGTEQPEKMQSITVSTPSLMHEEQISCTTFSSPPSSSAIKTLPYQKLNIVQSLGRESNGQ